MLFSLYRDFSVYYGLGQLGVSRDVGGPLGFPVPGTRNPQSALVG